MLRQPRLSPKYANPVHKVARNNKGDLSSSPDLPRCIDALAAAPGISLNRLIPTERDQQPAETTLCDTVGKALAAAVEGRCPCTVAGRRRRELDGDMEASTHEVDMLAEDVVRHP